jgi:S-adenosylmethionine-diacylgycerolhomoserine-N-methlytransferase
MSRSIHSTSLRDDLRVLWHLLARPVRGTTHAERLESFYRGQADSYDAFRARMLHGRRDLVSRLEFPPHGVWVDLGAGTGENVLYAGQQAGALSEIHLIDLSPSLLRIASRRAKERGLESVQTHLADASRLDLPVERADVVTCSYSLTMIPDWFEAILAAKRILKPGGVIGVADFYVSRKYAAAAHRQHGWLRRTFWTLWFAADNVHLSGDHAAMLHRHFEVERFEERSGKVPYLPLIRAPYYLFVGRKPATGPLESSR